MTPTLRAKAIDLNAIRARLGSIPDRVFGVMAPKIRLLLLDDMPALLAEIEESRASLKAKQVTINHSFISVDDVMTINGEPMTDVATAMYLVAPMRDYRP
jgi:hypothetical protein